MQIIMNNYTKRIQHKNLAGTIMNLAEKNRKRLSVPLRKVRKTANHKHSQEFKWSY